MFGVLQVPSNSSEADRPRIHFSCPLRTPWPPTIPVGSMYILSTVLSRIYAAEKRTSEREREIEKERERVCVRLE